MADDPKKRDEGADKQPKKDKPKDPPVQTQDEPTDPPEGGGGN